MTSKDDLVDDARSNGGIHVEGWGHDYIRVRAKVQVDANGGEDRTKEIAREISIATDVNKIIVFTIV